MTAEASEALADPLGVVMRLVDAIEPNLETAAIEDAVRKIAGGRAKRRRLAAALVARPSVLTDGRSPAPRVIGDLLIALRNAGAQAVSPPCCARCGKHLRTMQRRGQDWYCGTCGPQSEPCSSCGRLRPVSTRDRAGRPRCVRCPPAKEADPLAVITAVVTGIDPSLSAEVVGSSLRTAAPRPGQQRQLAWVLQERPELLTGDGALAPVPSVLRLIEALCDAGSSRIVRPACPRCDRVIPLCKPADGVRLCRNCLAKFRAVPCAGCSVVREPATRDDHGQPLCAHCLITDPINHETCAACGRRRPVAARTPRGPLCGTCRPVPTLTCSICGRVASCSVSAATGEPWCHACQQRWTRCSSCQLVRPVRGGTVQTPLCAACLSGNRSRWTPCATCGAIERLRSGSCTRCLLDERLRALLDDGTGRVRPELQLLHRTLAGAERPATVWTWLTNSSASAVLADLAKGPQQLSHAALDQLPPGKPVEHLRAVLVATAALPERDEHLVRLERWITSVVAERIDADERQLLQRYALWHLVRRLRQRNRGSHATHNQLVTVRELVRGAIALLDWLRGRGLTISTCRQGNLDAWHASTDATRRQEAGHFVRWAISQRMAGDIEYPATKWTGPAGPLDHDERWNQARRLLHDDTLDADDRVAGLLLLLYAQLPSAIGRLRLDQIETAGDQVLVHLGQAAVVVPEPLAALIVGLVAARRGHAVVGDPGSSHWLFPGGQPGRPISSSQLGERLRLIGIRPGQARSTALFQLATEVPAAILARMLGIHIGVAVQWQRAAGGDWTNYAADVSRRHRADDCR